MDVKIKPDEELLSLNTPKNYYDGCNHQNNMNDIRNEEYSIIIKCEAIVNHDEIMNDDKDHHEAEKLKMDIKKELDDELLSSTTSKNSYDSDHHQNNTNNIWSKEHSIDIKYEALGSHDEIIIEDNYNQESKHIVSKFPTTGVNSTARFGVPIINSIQCQSLAIPHIDDAYVKTEILLREVVAVILVENGSFHERNFVCKVCFDIFPSSDLLIQHKTVHSRLKYVKKKRIFKTKKAIRCESKSSNSKTLKIDKISHTIEKRFKCDDCDSQFMCVSGFKRHKLTHSNEKPFKCDKCSYATRRAYDLSVHSVIHNIENTFKCDKCNFSTKRALTLKRHKLTHTTDRPFKCDQCNYTAKRKVYVESHKRCIHWRNL